MLVEIICSITDSEFEIISALMGVYVCAWVICDVSSLKWMLYLLFCWFDALYVFSSQYAYLSRWYVPVRWGWKFYFLLCFSFLQRKLFFFYSYYFSISQCTFFPVSLIFLFLSTSSCLPICFFYKVFQCHASIVLCVGWQHHHILHLHQFINLTSASVVKSVFCDCNGCFWWLILGTLAKPNKEIQIL